jgi:hypothetical protein
MPTGAIDGGASRDAKARRRALGLLRAGRKPADVAARLRKDGLDPVDAARIIETADDFLQNELHRDPRVKQRPACHACGGRLAEDDLFCDACGARVREIPGLEPDAKAIAKGRTWLAAIAFFYVAGGITFALLTNSIGVFYLNAALAVVHLGLWLWAKTHLLPAAITALVLFVLVHVVSAFVDPSTLLTGVVVKVVFVVAIVQAIRAARTASSPAAAFD